MTFDETPLKNIGLKTPTPHQFAMALGADWQKKLDAAVIAEREACALACTESGSVNWAWRDAEKLCAERIRARSNVEVTGAPAHGAKQEN